MRDDAVEHGNARRWQVVGCSRRAVLGLGLGTAVLAGRPAWAQSPAPVLPLADTHSHMGLFGPTKSASFSPDRFMAEGHVKLVVWKWVPDYELVRRGANGELLSPPAPPDPDRMWAATEAGWRAMRDSATQAGAAIVLGKDDVEAARAGRTSSCWPAKAATLSMRRSSASTWRTASGYATSKWCTTPPILWPTCRPGRSSTGG
ncbi:MAG: hypothetical protein ACK4GB_06915 [Tepidimonas sp.]